MIRPQGGPSVGGAPPRARHLSTAGPAAGGRICEKCLKTSTVAPNRPLPLPCQPVPALSVRGSRVIGSLRLPIAGPYRPRAVLRVRGNGESFWTVRLWDVDRPVLRIVDTPTLRAFARVNRLPAIEAAIDEMLIRAAYARRP